VTETEDVRVQQMLADVEAFDDLDAAYREVRHKPYGFVFAGERWVLPHARSLGPKALAALEAADEGMTLEQLGELFRLMFGPEQAARWDALDPGSDVYQPFFTRWMAHSGVKLGEEPASSDSSESTGGSSKPTSDASTPSGSRKRSTAKKAPAKRAPRKAAKSAAPSAVELATQAGEAWLARHQELASRPVNS